jgi:hypothetical protein
VAKQPAQALLGEFAERFWLMKPSLPYLTDDDIRYECRVMARWCRLFRKTAFDWVILEAKRFRDRNPVREDEPASEKWIVRARGKLVA